MQQNLPAQSIILSQDLILNNLIHPKGYITCKPGELSSVKKIGTAKESIILAAVPGFSGDNFYNLTDHFKKASTIYAVTPAWFGGTAAPLVPDTAVQYAGKPGQTEL